MPILKKRPKATGTVSRHCVRAQAHRGLCGQLAPGTGAPASSLCSPAPHPLPLRGKGTGPRVKDVHSSQLQCPGRPETRWVHSPILHKPRGQRRAGEAARARSRQRTPHGTLPPLQHEERGEPGCGGLQRKNTLPHFLRGVPTCPSEPHTKQRNHKGQLGSDSGPHRLLSRVPRYAAAGWTQGRPRYAGEGTLCAGSSGAIDGSLALLPPMGPDTQPSGS